MSDTPATVLDSARLLRACRSLARRWRQQRSLREQVQSDLRAVRDARATLDSELTAIESALDDCAPRVADGKTLSPVGRVRWLEDKNRQAAIDRDRLAGEVEQLTAAVNAAASDHAAVEAERAKLERDALDAHDTLDRAQITYVGSDGAAMRPALPLRVVAAARDLRAVSKLRDQLQRDLKSARETADLYLAQAREAQAERERVEAESRAIADAYNALAGELADLKRARDTACAQLATAESDRTRLYACAEEQGEADVGNGLVLVRKTDLIALRSRQAGVDQATVRLINELLDRLLVTGSEVRA
jgi:RNA polymerase-interacting CarD/CdnL/TRCF family regulator